MIVLVPPRKSHGELLTAMIRSLRMRQASGSVRSVLSMAILIPDTALLKLALALGNHTGLKFCN